MAKAKQDLDTIIKSINKKSGANIIGYGIPKREYERIPFTSPRMNYCTYGGLPMGRLIEFYGEEGGGKTTTALDIVANYQQMQMTKEHPKRVAYFDSENTLDVDWATKLGVIVDDIVLLQPEEESAEEILQYTEDLMETGEVGLVILDSIASMASEQELDEKKSVGDRTYAGISMPLTKFGKESIMICKKYNSTVIGINQLRDDMGAMYAGAVRTPGGRAWKHFCLSGNTKFVTDKGLRRFRDCKDGETVIVVDKDGFLREATVGYYGKQPVQKVYLQKGRMKQEIICTYDHAWILSDGSKTNNIKVGDKLYYTDRTTNFDPITKRQLEMWCFGFVLADGCDYINKKAIGVRAYLYGDKGKYSSRFEEAGYRCAKQQNCVAYQRLHISKQRFLDGEGWKYLSAEDLRYMFCGYMAGDGSGNSCVTHDIRMLDFIKYSCSMCNYYISSIKEYVTNDKSFKAGQTAYRVYFTSGDNKYNHWQVYDIKDWGSTGVYCVTEPITHTFTLEYGIVTGNCSVRMEFRKGSYINDKGEEIKRSSDSPAGNKVLMSMAKNKTCPSNRRGGYYTINYAYGIDYLTDLIEVALKYDLIQQSGAWFTIIDPDTGEAKSEKIQGQSNIKDYLMEEENEPVLTFIENYIDNKV